MRSGRRLRTWVTPWVLVAGIGGIGFAAPRPALAEDTTTANVVAARKHFEKARSYYGQGAYREAIAELEAAHVLDPSAKDLVFNLGVVHEKLADIDDALRWFRLFTTMDLTTQERERADAYIKRLEGAKKEVEAKQTPPPPKPPPPPPHNGASHSQPDTAPSAPPRPPERPPGGRVDALTISALTVTTLGLGFGVVLAVRAWDDRPPVNTVTGAHGYTFQDLQNQQSNAHFEALLADIGFGVALVGAVATTTLYFGRPRATAPAPALSAAPIPGGGAMFVQGSF
jgi:tetratricopeptide (TPR) repeat protein